MKRYLSTLLMIAVFSAMVIVTANAEEENKLVGKWLIPSPVMLEFLADGTVRSGNPFELDTVVPYRMEGAKIIFAIDGDEFVAELTESGLLKISANGEEIILAQGPDSAEYYEQPFVTMQAESMYQSRSKAKFLMCLNTLRNVAVAQEMHYMDYNEYAASKDAIAYYMMSECPYEDGGTSEECAGKVDEMVKGACDPDSEWTLEGGTEESPYDYTIKATSGDDTKCKICVTPYGALPEDYSECTEGRLVQCPE